MESCNGKWDHHEGIDIGGIDKSGVRHDFKIHSFAGGVVTYTGYIPRAGHLVIIRHNDKIESRYLHMLPNKPVPKKQFYVKENDVIKGNTLLGNMGQSGRVKGLYPYHLHFDIQIGQRGNKDTYIDPLLILDKVRYVIDI